MIYLLDTDTLIFLIRGLKNPKKAAHYAHAQKVANVCRAEQKAGHTIAVSAISMSELEYGARKSVDYVAEIAAVNKFLMPFDQLAVTPRPHPAFPPQS